MTDNAIVERILDGHTQEFSLLVERYQKAVYNLAYQFVGQQEEALDLARIIFLKAYIHLSSYRRKEPFHVWLHQLAVMQGLDWQGKSQKENGKATFSIEGTDLVEPVSQELLMTSKDQSRIREGLAQLLSWFKKI